MSKSGTGEFSDFKSQVLTAIDIVDLIGQSVSLKHRGRDYVGLCPFHQEKTPSFHVRPDRQYFNCFGCKAKGNAIDFVMQRDRIAFVEALNLLGEQAGIERPRSGFSKERLSEKQALLDAQSAACSLFEKLLAHPQGGLAAREYLAKRGFNQESIRQFHVGLAADAWDTLLSSEIFKKFKPEQLAVAGLVKKREKGDGFYDTFRNRLMFPIRDENARVIAFGGRQMGDNPPKYLNSPETPIFAKSRCVFGLDLARQKIIESRTVVVVEGYTDVVMAHQYGASNVVAILGTGMTEQHVTLLRRFADRIVLLFDADSAGDTAIARAVGLFITQPVEIAIGQIDNGLDPDEFLLKEGVEAFERMIAASPDALAYKWKQLSRAIDDQGGSLTAQQKAVEQYMAVLSDARKSGPVDSIRWGSALARVSRLTGIGVDDLNRRFGSVVGSRSSATGGRAPVRPAAPTPAGKPVRHSGRDRAERQILGVLLCEPGRWHDVQKTVAPADFSEEVRRQLAELYWTHQRDEGEPVFNEFLSLLGDQSSEGQPGGPVLSSVEGPDLQQLAIDVVEEVERLPDMDLTLADSVRYLQEERQREEERKLSAQLRRADGVMSEEDELAMFRATQEMARRGDLRRN